MTQTHSPRGRPDDRGVSEVIGFILIFGLLVAGLSIVQIYGVPAQNERVEFDHSLRVQDDMTVLADNIEVAGRTGAPVATTVEAGTTYPSRLFLFNPGSPAGNLKMGEPTDVTLSGAVAADETGDYWDGSDRTLSTRAVVYEPRYNVYDSAPVTYIEHGVVYNDNPRGANTTLKQGSLVRGSTISLVTVDGTFASGGSAQSLSVQTVPISGPSRSVTVTGSGSLSLTIQSGLSVGDWQELLADEPNVLDVTGVGGTVTITLDPAVDYELRLARVGLESGYGVDPGPAYLTTVDGTVTVGEGATRSVAFEVRDAYNNPVPGVTVDASAAGGSLAASAVRTGGDGRAVFEYTAPSVTGSTVGTDQVTAAVGTTPDAARTATVDVSVTNTDGSGAAEVGIGGQSEWSPENNSTQVTVANGRWNNISGEGSSIDSITLSDGELVTVERCKSGVSGSGNPQVFTECKFVDTLRLSFSLNDSADRYTAEVNLVDCDRDGSFAGATCKVNKLSFEDQRDVTVYKNDQTTPVLETSLSNDAATDILTAAGTDLLDATQYSSASQSTLDELKLTDATWLTGLIEGRVVATIDTS